MECVFNYLGESPANPGCPTIQHVSSLTWEGVSPADLGCPIIKHVFTNLVGSPTRLVILAVLLMPQ